MGEVERPQHNLLQRCGVLGQANGPVCAPWSDPMRHDQAAGWGHDVEAVRAETPPNLNVGADKARWGRVVVAPHRHQRVVSDLAGHGHVGRIADRRQPKKHFGGGEFGDGAGGAMPAAKVTNVHSEVVEGHLCGLEAVDAGGAPPTLGDELDRCLNDAFAVPVPRWARVNTGAVMLRHRDEGTLHPSRAGDDHRGHPINTPPFRGATQPAQDLVDPDDQMSLIIGVRAPRPELPRMGQCADEDVELRAPRGVAQLEPVPLDLFTRRMVNVDMGAAFRRRARLSMRTQIPGPYRTSERRIGTFEPQLCDLDEQNGRPHMRVIGEPLTDVG